MLTRGGGDGKAPDFIQSGDRLQNQAISGGARSGMWCIRDAARGACHNVMLPPIDGAAPISAPLRRGEQTMVKRLVSTIALALVLASSLALASCGGGKEGIPLDNGQSCTRQQFPQCGLDGAH